VQVFLLWFVWRVSGLMLIGMALYKWKVLSGYRSAGFYRRMVMAGLGIGLTVEGFGMYYMEAAGWPVEVMIPGLITNYFSSLFTAGGYIGLVMLMHQSGWWAGLKGKLAAVGRMAFTNYLAQTLICTTIFYGHGFGLFGHVERWQQVLLVGAVWVLQIYWSKLWLERYQAGPLEWLWRCVTYLRVMPLRRREEVGTVEPPVLRV
jgi:uncharacterized protein